MSICNRCGRFFVYKNSLRRHQQKRRNPCRPAVTSCAQCGNKFTCFNSLEKHKKLYCKAEQQHHHQQQQQHPLKIDPQYFLNQLPSANATSPSHNNNHDNDDDADARHHHQLYTPQSVAEFTPPVSTNTYFHTDSLQELLNQINFSPMMMTNDDDSKAVEGSIPQQSLQQILDNIVKEEEEVVNENNSSSSLSSTTTIWNDITYALDDWLQKLTMMEERQLKVSNLQEKINRTLTQIQQDGLLSIYDFGMLNYIGHVWINLLPSHHTTATINNDIKRLIIQDLLKLYDAQQISYELFIEIIVPL